MNRPPRAAAGALLLGALLSCAGCATVRREPLTVQPPAPVHRSASLRVRSGTVLAAKGDIREVYRKVAPATVLIRSGTGFGSGVVFDARGYVLTNHHVIASAEVVDFKRRVEVQRGALDAKGVMTLDPTPMHAWVLKSDAAVDLAVLQLIDPPADLRAVKVAVRDPVPGEPVSALGHGGIGLLWAIKDGEISSVGKLSTHLALLVGSSCTASDDAVEADSCRASQQSMEQERDQLEQEAPALVIQSSCPISPGDSGGPLVNRAGEVVGLNAFLRSDARVPVATSFHVHVTELRRFLKEVPREPIARVPMPVAQRAALMRAFDLDGDGVAELQLDGQGDPLTVFVDVARRSTRLEPRFDYVLQRQGSTSTAWFDLNGDGTADRVVVEARGAPVGRAWALGAGGELGAFEGAASLVSGPFHDPETRRRFESLRERLLLVVGHAEDSDVPPEPFEASTFTLSAFDRDGRPGLATADVPWARTIAVFPEGLAPTKRSTISGEALRTASAPVFVVLRAGSVWVLLRDRQVALKADAAAVVVGAWRIDEAGAVRAPAPEFLGRDVAHLIEREAVAPARARARSLLAKIQGLARAEGAPAGFPVARDAGGWVEVLESGVEGFERAVTGQSDSLAGESLSMALGSDGLTDFMWFSREGWEWFSYDTDHDGAFDRVVIRREGRPFLARRVSPQGEVTLLNEDATAPLQPRWFAEPARAAAFAKLATVFFTPALIGE